MKLRTKVYDITSANVISEVLGLAELCHGEEDVPKVLELLVEKIARIMQTDVCSLYLLDSQTKELVLTATKGLEKASIGHVRMPIGVGLVGKTIEWLKPVSMSSARRSKQFKFFPETGEERFSAFLSVPLIYNRNPVGVLVVQNEKATRLSTRSVHLLMTLAIPAMNVIEKTKLLGTFGHISVEERDLKKGAPGRTAQGLQMQGVGASPGIAIGRIKIIRRNIPMVAPHLSEEPIHADVEKMRMLEAFRWVEEEILHVQKKADKKFGMEELSIFDAYKMVLESEPFKQQILEEIDKGASALKAVEKVIGRFSEELGLADDEYIRERVYDIQDLGRKIIDRLLYGSNVPSVHDILKEEAVVFSDFWSISDFVEMDLEKIKGLISPSGGASSHIAILAKSLGVPAVLGVGPLSEHIREGDRVIMDGSTGIVIVNPVQSVLEAYEREVRAKQQAQKIYRKSAKLPAVPQGGKRVVIGANMGIVAHVNEALEEGAEEVGLYRTEFPFLVRRSLPTEEEQTQLYRKILTAMGRRPITIRTLDIGGDKYIPYLNLPHEANPFLGWRSIRISLEREDLFRIQLRALFKASPAGRLKILFPMISSLEEIRRVKEIVRDVKRELSSTGVPIASTVPLGVMIEVPASVEIAEALIREVQFFSIGTNDLIQYTLAVDRNNPKVAKLFNPFHPAVLRLIHRTIETAHRFKKPVGVCGEMAEQPEAVALLVGMEVDSLSMSVPLVSKIKHFISRLPWKDTRELISVILALNSAEAIRQKVSDFFKKKGLEEFLIAPGPNIC